MILPFPACHHTHRSCEQNRAQDYKYQFGLNMIANIRYILKALGVTVLSGLLVHNIRDLLKIISEMRSVQQAKIEKIEDVQMLIKQKKSSKGHILKLTPYYFQPLRYIINIHTAQKLKYEPNDEKILKMARKQLSTPSYFYNKRQKQQDHSDISWYARIDRERQDGWPEYHKIQRFGKIKGDIFHVRRQFEPIRYMTRWGKISNWFYELLYKQRGPIEQSRSYSFFVGPVVGFLNYEVNLMKDSKIIIACDIEDGKIIPSVTAASKSQIMAYFKEIINQKYIQIGILTVAATLIARWLLSDIKRQINAMKLRNSKASMKYFTMEHTSQDKQCIICYNSCRNVIFFDCRHMIMCYECSQTYDSDVCPYCKNQIDDIKPLIGIP